MTTVSGQSTGLVVMVMTLKKHRNRRFGAVAAGFGLVILYISGISLAGEESFNFTGIWKNQRGSTLEITQEGNQVSGTFTTAVARTKACAGYGAPFVGFINENALSISMSMEGCGSPVVIGQTGILLKGDNGKEKIKIQALVQKKGPECWDSQNLVADYYQRIK